MRFVIRVIAHATRTFTQESTRTCNVAVYKVENLGTNKFM
jgi:hypothetical protein